MGWDLALFSELLLRSLAHWWIIIPAVLIGTIAGAVPGFSAANTIIILLPLTLAIDVESALIFMMALYCASQLGNGIPAILVNIPGSGGAAATTLDGYPMAMKGEGQHALIACFVASVIGGIIGTVVVMATLPYLARVGLSLHSVEMVVIMLFGLTLIAAISAQDMLKGLLAALLGLLIGAIGTDHIYATPRATFGFIELYDGVPLVPALIGLFAVSEAFVMIERHSVASGEGEQRARYSPWSETFKYVVASLRRAWLICWTGVIGVVVGVVPGAGADIAAFVAYQRARAHSRYPERFGQGVPEGVIAPEAANNGVTSGTLVPLMAIGVPGGATAAIMMVVLQYHGVILGPRLAIAILRAALNWAMRNGMAERNPAALVEIGGSGMRDTLDSMTQNISRRPSPERYGQSVESHDGFLPMNSVITALQISGCVKSGIWPAPEILRTSAVGSASATSGITGANTGGLWSPRVRSTGPENGMMRSRSRASCSGSFASSRKVGAFRIIVCWNGGGNSAQAPGPSATVSTNCSAAPAWSPEMMRSTTAPTLSRTSASIGALEGSFARSENSGGSWAIIPRKRSGRSPASRSVIDAPNEFPATQAGPRSRCSMSAPRSATSSCTLPWPADPSL